MAATDDASMLGRPVPATGQGRGSVASSKPSRPVSGAMIALLVASRLAVAAIVLITVHDNGFADPDVSRFDELASAPGRPYEDFDVEYAPIETVVIFALAGDGLDSTGTRLVILALVADLATASALAFGWSRRIAATYLLISTPLLVFVYLRFDLFPVALCAWGFALARRGRDGAAGALLALAVLSKLWPVVLLPALFIDGRRRAVVWATALMSIGTIAWMAVTTLDAPRQVLTFRGATGWGVDSTVGTILWIVTRGPVALESGSQRIGAVPGWAQPLMILVLLVALGVVWLHASRRRTDPLGVPALGAIGSLLVMSPLFSLQYAIWLTPFAAIATGEDHGRPLLWLVAGVSVTSAVLFALYEKEAANLVSPFMVLRIALVATLAFWAMGTSTWRTAGERGFRRLR